MEPASEREQKRRPTWNFSGPADLSMCVGSQGLFLRGQQESGRAGGLPCGLPLLLRQTRQKDQCKISSAMETLMNPGGLLWLPRAASRSEARPKRLVSGIPNRNPQYSNLVPSVRVSQSVSPTVTLLLVLGRR